MTCKAHLAWSNPPLCVATQWHRTDSQPAWSKVLPGTPRQRPAALRRCCLRSRRPWLRAAPAPTSSRPCWTWASTSTPAQLSNVMARLRRQRQGAVVLSSSSPGLEPSHCLTTGAGNLAARPPADRAGTRMASVPTLQPAPNLGLASKFGAHDPRLLDEVMRSTPDMKALAKLAPKLPR